MIKPECKACGKELEKFGGILLSPPNVVMIQDQVYTPELDIVFKTHLCLRCYEYIMDDIKNGRYKNEK